jgi:hypothetical protein
VYDRSVRPKPCDGDEQTLSHDFLLKRATMHVIRLTRKLKCVTSSANVHIHCRATSASSLLATGILSM